MRVSEVPALRNFWYPVAYADSLEDQPLRVRIFGEDFVVWRSNAEGGVSAAADECPHRSARLSQGWLENGCLVCPYHGWQFASDGTCVLIPAAGPDVPVPKRAHAQSVLADIRYRLIWLCVGLPRAPIPDLPEAEDPDYVMRHEVFEVWHASAPRVIDNGLDVGHVAFVHRNSIGSAAEPKLGDFEVQRDDMELRFTVSLSARITEQRPGDSSTDQLIKRTTLGYLVQPFVFRGVLEYPDGLRHVLFKTATPIDDESTLFCQFVARNDRPTDEQWQKIIDLDNRIQGEDKEMLEGVRPDWPLKVSTEVHHRSDRMTIEYRRILADLAGEVVGVTPDEEWARAW